MRELRRDRDGRFQELEVRRDRAWAWHGRKENKEPELAPCSSRDLVEMPPVQHRIDYLDHNRDYHGA